VTAYPDELRNGHRLVSYLSPQTSKPFPLRFERQGKKIEITCAHRIGVMKATRIWPRDWQGLGSFRHLIIRCRRFCGREKGLRSCTNDVLRVIRFIWFIRKTGT